MNARYTRNSLLLILVCEFILRAQPAPQPLRELPLNHLPDSRASSADTRGFYWMPAAIGDDYFDGSSPLTRIRRHFRVAQRLGARYLRCAFSWNGIEKSEGSYDWTFWDTLVAEAEKSSIALIPYVAYTPQWAARDPQDFWKQPPRDPQAYAALMSRLAARYRGRIRAWEIWNEPDNKDYWTGTVEEFATLVRSAATSIRAADPGAVLVLGGMAYGPGDFFRSLIADHHIDRCVDVVAAHAYPETWLNERAEVWFQDRIPAMQRMVAEDRSGAGFWLNEMGYADYRFSPAKASVYGIDVFYNYEHTAGYQAEMLFKFYLMAMASRTSLAGWYRIDDFPRSETRLGTDLVNFHLGVVNARGAAKPALFAMRLFNRLFRTPSVLVDAPIERPADSQSVIHVFRAADNRIIVVGWLRSSKPDEVPAATGTLKDGRAEVVTAGLPCVATPLHYYDPQQRRPVASVARVKDRSVTNIHLRGDRVFVGEFVCKTNAGDN